MKNMNNNENELIGLCCTLYTIIPIESEEEKDRVKDDIRKKHHEKQCFRSREENGISLTDMK